MNGKKAKLIRVLSGHKSENSDTRSYHIVKGSSRIRVHKEMDYIANKEVVVSQITTHSFALNDSPRKLGKLLKKTYKEDGGWSSSSV